MEVKELSGEEKQLLACLRMLPERNQKMVVDLAKTLVKQTNLQTPSSTPVLFEAKPMRK